MLDEHEALFKRWEERHTETSAFFVRDGIVNREHWDQATIKIVFLLKEVNRGKRSHCASLPLQIQKDLRRMVDDAPWREVGRWAFTLLADSKRSITYSAANENYENACRSVALVNFKKTAGTNTAYMPKVRRFARRDRDLLNEQITILNPDVVVCCGKREVFRIAQTIFDDAARATPSGAYEAGEIAGRCLIGKRVWIDFIHPRMRRVKSSDKFAALSELRTQADEALRDHGGWRGLGKHKRDSDDV